MLRTQDIPPEEMSEVVRVASAMYERERAADQERKATVDAAEEMGLPAAYLERAAAEVHARRVAQIQQRRRRRVGIVATVAAVAALGGGWRLLNPPPPAAFTTPITAAASSQWTLDNASSQASYRVRDSTLVIEVDRFIAQNGSFRVNAYTKEIPNSLRGYSRIRFRVRGDGLERVRLDLEAGDTRWKSGPVAVTNEWREETIDLSKMDYQTRLSPGADWGNRRFRAPGEIERLGFKVGETINPIEAAGQVEIADVRFE